MSWYDPDLVKCHQCGERFSTPIDKLNHGMHCRVKRSWDGFIEIESKLFGCDLKGNDRVKVLRGVIYYGNKITVEGKEGKRYRMKVSSIESDGKISVESFKEMK
jgi:hypothetical protein